MTRCLEASLELARSGIPNFVVGRDKEPLTEHGLKDATTDEATISGWFARYPDAGVAVPLGPRVGLVLDVDPRHGGNESLAKLIAENGPLPSGPEAITGGGGSHYWFAWPGGEVPITHGFLPGLDLQSEGSYVVLPPSLHASGNRYSWRVPLLGTKLPLPPPWLLKAADHGRSGRGRQRFEPSPGGQIPHGRHHDWIVSTAASLASRAPGISETDLLRTVRAVARETLDDTDEHETEIVDAVRSALSKFGRETPAEVESLFDEKGRPDRAAFVDALLLEHHFAALSDSRELLVYLDGVYDGRASSCIDGWVEGRFRDREETASSNFRAEVELAIRARSYVDRESFNPQGLLNLANGVLDVGTGELLLHEPGRRFTYKLPATYDPGAACPTFDRFLAYVLPDERARELALEAMGYALTPTNPHQVAFVLVGEGENGKSTLLGVLRTMLGDPNVAAETLQRLTDGRFSAAELWGKLANLAADIPDAPVRHTGAFKMLTGGDLISTERKHRDPFRFVWGGKAFFSCNKLPEVEDDTHAFWRRWIVLLFSVRIAEQEKDPQLLEKLKVELPGILNRALDALRRLQARGRFDVPETVASVREEWARRSNSFRWFLAERCRLAPGKWTTKQDLMVAYSEFCQEQGLVAKDSREVGTQIGRWLPGVRASQHRIHGRLTKTWENVALRDPQVTLSTDAGDASDAGGSPSRDAREEYSTREGDPHQPGHPYQRDPEDLFVGQETRADRARAQLDREGEQ